MVSQRLIYLRYVNEKNVSIFGTRGQDNINSN